MLRRLLSAGDDFLTKTWLRYFTYGLALSILSILFSFHNTVTNDTWWHLRVGKEIWEGTFSFYDSYSWTAPEAFWPAHELAYEWLLYGLWMLGGETFILAGALNIALVIGSLLLLIPPKRVREKFGLATNVLVPLLILVAGASLLDFVQIRAQAISFFLFVLTLRLILAMKPYWIPPLFLLWVWLHGSVFSGVAIMGVATLVMIGRWLFERKNQQKLKDALHFSVAGILSLVATCLSPLGLGLWVYLLQAFSFGETAIAEWQPLYTKLHFLIYALIAVALVALSLWRLWKVKFTWEVIYLSIMSAFFLAYAFDALRVYSNFVLMALPLMLMAAMTLGKRKKEKLEPELTKSLRITVLSSVGLMVVIALIYSWIISSSMLRVGSQDPFKDEGVAEAVRSEQCAGHLWNDYDTGSYMIWFLPDVPVSIDSRFDLYPRWVTDASGVTFSPDEKNDPAGVINRTFKKYDIRCFLLTRGEDSGTLRERGVPIIAENEMMVLFEVSPEGIPSRKDN